MDFKKRLDNEKKFTNWSELENGNRIYYFDIEGRYGWKARYIKEVDNNEITIRFYQEIYNESNILVELHENYPVDKGHREV
jgi:hypothetical protein